MAVFEKDYPRFKFPGFGQTGTCFLRVRVNSDGTSVFLCSQLKNYTGTSVTNAVEEIFVKAVEVLQQEGVYKPKRKHWYSLKPELDIQAVAARMRWVEYYPKGTGVFDSDSYALVSFDSELRPVWNYMSLSRIIKECAVPETFFQVSGENLAYVQ